MGLDEALELAEPLRAREGLPLRESLEAVELELLLGDRVVLLLHFGGGRLGALSVASERHLELLLDLGGFLLILRHMVTKQLELLRVRLEAIGRAHRVERRVRLQRGYVGQLCIGSFPCGRKLLGRRPSDGLELRGEHGLCGFE